jgi:hypothetical protein
MIMKLKNQRPGPKGAVELEKNEGKKVKVVFMLN